MKRKGRRSQSPSAEPLDEFLNVAALNVLAARKNDGDAIIFWRKKKTKKIVWILSALSSLKIGRSEFWQEGYFLFSEGRLRAGSGIRFLV